MRNSYYRDRDGYDDHFYVYLKKMQMREMGKMMGGGGKKWVDSETL